MAHKTRVAASTASGSATGDLAELGVPVKVSTKALRPARTPSPWRCSISSELPVLTRYPRMVTATEAAFEDPRRRMLAKLSTPFNTSRLWR
jgi:hypothetical protein